MSAVEILASLTLEEKIALIAGANLSNTHAIPEKNVPTIKLVDGPNGVRSPATDEIIQSACFPAACSLASTFDPALARRTGEALAIEARGKNAQCILGPTVCIHRHPLGGRNFESFSEDPFLTGKMASQLIQGLQSLGVSATIKHFVANEQETSRTSVDEKISERALREIYLRPFEIAVKEANPWALMTAYNLVNGTHCDDNKWLLQTVLRGEWKWKGLVMSDWGGTNSVASAIEAGLDLEMPGPPRIRKLAAVKAALEAHQISEAQVDDRARSILEFALKLKAHEALVDPATRGANTDTPELRAMLRESAARGMVLLKNEGAILPLSQSDVRGKKIAVIGFAKDAMAHGGGSAAVNSYYKVSAWDGLRGALGDSAELLFAVGAHRDRLLPPISNDGKCGRVIGLDGEPGFTRIFYEEGGNAPTKTLHGQKNSAYSPFGSQESRWRVLELAGDFTPSESGSHYMACSGLGPTRLFIDGQMVFEQPENSKDPMGSLFMAAPEPEIQHYFEAGKTYRVRVCSEPPHNIGLEVLEGRSGARVGFSLESVHDADLKGEAARIAAAADMAIIFTGHDQQWETEGQDQESFDLPGGQNALVSAVAAANRNVIVVNSTGVPVSMPWLTQVKAMVQAWFPGQECGNAIADILTGAMNPEGNLPVTFPRSIEDAPAHGNFPGRFVDGKLHVAYEEGVFVGYRHFDRLPADKVNFPFGHGLSYSTFEFGHATVIPRTVPSEILSDGTELLQITVSVTNNGDRAGRVLVQVYAGRLDRQDNATHPIKALVGFQKVSLQPSEKTVVQIEVQKRDLAYFDETRSQWVVDSGEYGIFIGSSASEIHQTCTVSLAGHTWKP